MNAEYNFFLHCIAFHQCLVLKVIGHIMMQQDNEGYAHYADAEVKFYGMQSIMRIRVCAPRFIMQPCCSISGVNEVNQKMCHSFGFTQCYGVDCSARGMQMMQ